jgi:PTH1 family peptidyl-tRNA hydrolase
MRLVLGLGNPGTRYAPTRHNVGFRCVAEVARRLEMRFDDACPEYREAVGEGPAGPVTLLQPQTFMNRSGLAARAWARRRGAVLGPGPWHREPLPLPGDPDRDPAPWVVPVVVCDDIHLPLGSIRIRAAGRAGGQNGLASVIATAGGEQIPRLRLGVGSRQEEVAPADWADWVLAPFAAGEREEAAALIDRGAEALLTLLERGPQAAGSRHNRRVRPGRDLPGPS